MPKTNPYRCKSCGYVFVEPKLYVSGGAKVKMCPFCDGEEIEEFETIPDEKELNVLGEIPERSLPDIPHEEIEKNKDKNSKYTKIDKKGRFRHLPRIKKLKNFIVERDLQYFLLFLIIFAVLTKSSIDPWNGRSRMATIDSLVDRGTFVIDNSVYVRTGDKVYINGHFYSDKPPVLSFLAAGPYFLMKSVGLTFQNNEGLVYYLLTLIFVGTPAAITVYVFNKSLKLVGLEKSVRLRLTIALGAGTLLLPWATVFNNHVPAMALCFTSFYFLLKSKFQFNKKNIFLAGFLVSLGATIDVVAGPVFFVLFLIYILWNRFERKSIMIFLIGVLPPFLLHCILNIQITGGILPAELVPQYFLYPGSPWLPEQLAGFASWQDLTSLLTYAFHSTFGYSGFFSHSPILLIFFFALPQIRHKLKKEGVIITLATIILLGFYIVGTNNYGGWSYSIRWWIPLIPFLMFFGSLYLQKQKSYKIFYLLLAASVVISAVGIISPWTNMGLGPIPFVNNLKQLLGW